MTEQQSIREEMSETLFRFYDHGTQPNALVEADALLASHVIRRIQAEALREAAKSGQAKMFAPAVYIGPERLRLGISAEKWLLETADDIEKGKR